jgi:hypothetical protein
MEEKEMPNRRNKNNPNNGGCSVGNSQFELLYIIWQGHVERS